MNDNMDKNERFTWKTVHGWQTPAFLEVMNGLDKKNQRLKEENEHLKEALQILKHRHSLLHDVCLEAECDRDSLKKDVISLEKENEQLKGEIKRLKCINKQLEERLDKDIALNMDCGDIDG